MRNKYVYFFIVLCLLVANISLLFNLFKEKKDFINQKQQKESYINSNSDLFYDVDQFSQFDTLQFISDNQFINKNIKLKDINGDFTTLEKAVGNSTKLVFRYSELDCNTCYQKVLNDLTALINSIGANNIMIITSYYNQRELYNFMKANNINQNVYNIGANNLGLAVEKYDIPFLFILDKTYRVKLLFIPYKRYPLLTQKYFSTIKKGFFTSQ